jgi:3'-phosphoadenosine 5'-phosphosulfate sulfotransferase (PAPS reductase)/FAD synthetase
VEPGEDARAGRWSGFNKTECGLHTATQESSLVSITRPSLSERATEA